MRLIGFVSKGVVLLAANVIFTTATYAQWLPSRAAAGEPLTTALIERAESSWVSAPKSMLRTPSEADATRGRAALASAPIRFERNEGQIDGGFDFVARGTGYAMFIQPTGALMNLTGDRKTAGVGITLVGSRADARARAEDPSQTIVNYYHGRDRSRWHTGVQSFGRVRYAGVYDGIDVEYYGRGNKLEYDFIVGSNADASKIGMLFDGMQALCVDDHGALVVETPAGEIRNERPRAYQRLADGSTKEVSSRFTIRDGNVGFELGSYDRSRELIIDPSVSTTYIVPTNYLIDYLAVDGSGNLYIATMSPPDGINASTIAFPTGNRDWWYDVVVLKINADGSTAYCTYIGGSDYDDAQGLAIDSAGNAYVVGMTSSIDFPTTAGVLQPTITKDNFFSLPSREISVVKLSPTGALVFGTYLGGETQDWPAAIAVDASSNVYVAGASWSRALPGTIDTRPQMDHYNYDVSFVAKLNPDATSLAWMTLLGGQRGSTDVSDIALDETGAVYVTGETDARLPITTGSYNVNCGGCEDAFVGKLTPAGALQSLRYVAGNGDDVPTRIGIDSSHNVYVVGRTRSLDFPVTPDALQRVPLTDSTGDDNGFFVKLDPTLSTILYSTYFTATGGSTWPTDIEVDSSGNANLLVYSQTFGTTASDFPLLNDFPNVPPLKGGTYIMRFNASDQLQYSACFGGDNAGKHMARLGDDLFVPLSTTGGYLVRRVSPSGQSDVLIGAYGPLGRSDAPAQQYQMVADVGTFPSGTQVLFGSTPALSLNQQSANVISGMPPVLGAGVYDVTVTTPSGSTTLKHAWEAVSGSFSISSISPATVAAYAATQATISGSGIPPGLRITLFNSLNSQGDVLWRRLNPNTIYIIVPPTLGPGVYDVMVTATAPYFGDVTKTLTGGLTITQPVIGAFTPSGSSAGGQDFNIAGASVDLSSSVTLDGLTLTPTTYAGKFTTVAHAPGKVDVSVSTPTGSATFPGGYTYIQAITATNVQPQGGPAAGGTTITITGTGFQPGARVFLDCLAATNVSVLNSTTITAVTPRHSSATATVTVVNPDGGNADVYTDYRYSGPWPMFISTATGPAAGGPPALTVSGDQFDATDQVSFGGVPANVTAYYTSTTVGASTLTVVPPAHAAGMVDVTVVNGAGESGTAIGMYTYLDAAPAVTSISPTFGPASGGTAVTITGTGFSSATKVTIGGKSLQNVTINSTTITGNTPPNAAGSSAVWVINSDGQKATTTFTYMAPPTLTTVTPASGPVAGGTAVTLTGTNFDSSATVTFGGTPAASVTFSSSTSLQATTPAHAAGDVDVVVTNADGGFAKKTAGFRFLPPPPTITSFTPTIGVVGSQVVITGTNFVFVTSVKFTNNVSAVFTADSDTQITATVPASSVTGPISVTTQSGSATTSSNYTIDTTGPRIDSFTPTSGVSGTSVILTGLRFTGATQVKFGGVAASSFTVDSDTQITAVVPPTALTGAITVTSSAGTGTSATSFTAAPRFATAPFSPTSGPSGTSVTISGVNFQGTTQVLFNGVAVSAFNVNTGGTAITTTVPTAATTGPITVTTPVASITTTTSFAVSPTITSFTPAGGGAGTVVTITGLHFTGATSVRFAGISATFTVVNDTTITATVPAGAPTGTITVTTPAGTATSATSFLAGAKITSFTPVKGDVGTVVTLTGQYFTGATAVSFNGTPATTFNVVSDTSITATVPAGATTGPISVTTSVATSSSSSNFYMPITITGFSPTSGPGGTVITITGTSLTGVNKVTINGMQFLYYTVISPTQLRATIPSLASTGPLVIYSPYWSVQTTASYTVTPGPPPTYRGDSNGDGAVDVADVFYLIRYLYAAGPAPIHTADANSDGKVNVGDVFFLINYVFAGGPAPAASLPAQHQ